MNKISVNGGITLVNSRFTGYREKSVTVVSRKNRLRAFKKLKSQPYIYSGKQSSKAYHRQSPSY